MNTKLGSNERGRSKWVFSDFEYIQTPDVAERIIMQFLSIQNISEITRTIIGTLIASIKTIPNAV